MKWIGLTGGIATGKSTVKKLIEGRGHPVIDADLISHQLTEVGQLGYRNVVSHFGNSVVNPDKSLNRKALGQIIFNDPHQRTKLENILHPLIQVELAQQKKIHLGANRAMCFYDVPLLFEKDLKKEFDLVVMVWCDPQIQKLRLMTRNNFSETEAELRLAAQLNMAAKIKNSDYCLDNSTNLLSLEKQVHNLVQTIG